LSIILLAFAVRLVGIPWGLAVFDKNVGNAYYHPDENKIVLGAKNFPADIFSRTDLRYPTGLFYMIGILGIPIKLVKIHAVSDVQLFFILGRVLSTLFGVASVYLTYLLGKKVANRDAGLIAAGLLAISLYPMREASVATTDVATSFWTMAVLLSLTKLTRESGVRFYLGVGVLLGVLVGTKYTGGFVLLPVLIILGDLYLRETSDYRRRMAISCAAMLLTSLVVFLMTTPSAFLFPHVLLDSLRYENTRLAGLRSPLWSGFVYLYFVDSLVQSTNFFIAITIIAAMGWVLIKRPNLALVSYVLFILCFYLYFNTSLSARYWVMPLPVGCVLAGWGLEKIMRRPGKIYLAGGFALLLLCVGWGIYQGVLMVDLLYHDTRSDAAEYFVQLDPKAQILNINKTIKNGWAYPALIKRAAVASTSEIPQYIVFAGTGDDKQEGTSYLLDVGNLAIRYTRVRKFVPVNNLQIEFLSPVIEVYQRAKD